MTKRLSITPTAGSLEEYAELDELFSARAQHQAFCRYLEDLLLPGERNKMLTTLTTPSSW